MSFNNSREHIPPRGSCQREGYYSEEMSAWNTHQEAWAFQFIEDFLSPMSGAEASELPYSKELEPWRCHSILCPPMSHEQQGLVKVLRILRSSDFCVVQEWG